LRYLSFDQSFGMFLPTYNHLWFVAYLWIYTILALAIWPAIMAWERRFPLTGITLFFLPVALFGLYRAFLFPHWPETHILWRDVYAHMHYGTAFLVGIVLARQADAWALLGRSRHRLLAATLCITAVGLALSGPWERQTDWRGAAFAFIREGLVWCVICTLFGYVHHHIRKGSQLLSTLTEAVFPFYIVHQTAIVVVGYTLKAYDLPVGLEASVVLASTAASCVAAYWCARRIPLLRLALGLKPQAAD
jgi:peptidoglycan/LPS O-acetylase OafA/YrhL